jgi:thioredoxin-like negative regulator of GroEL
MNTKVFEEMLQNEKLLDKLTEDLNTEIKNDKSNLQAKHQLAKVFTKKNEFSKAVNLYIEILKINPEDELAQTQKDFIMTILSQGRLDIYACTNTHIDPWQ